PGRWCTSRPAPCTSAARTPRRGSTTSTWCRSSRSTIRGSSSRRCPGRRGRGARSIVVGRGRNIRGRAGQRSGERKRRKMKKRVGRTLAMAGALGGSVLLGVAGGTIGVSTAGASSLPSTIKIYSIQDASGAAGVVGQDDEKGINLAIKQINATHLLGNSTISITYGDSATTPTQAANLATQAAVAKYPVVIGPPSSATAIAVAPIMARANLPTVFTQAGGPGTLVSKYM